MAESTRPHNDGNIGPMDINRIMAILPHRYPFLLIDRVEEVLHGPDPDSRAGRKFRAIKCVTMNEPFFPGHFPHRPVMPGVLIVEAMAQAAALACYRPGRPSQDVAIAAIKDAKFRRPVVPGDRLEIFGECTRDGGQMLSVDCECRVDGQVVASATILAKMFDFGGGAT
jgi:3-hydroxyacyl-[acyl-carrier-protein] dehydratase